MPGWLVLNWRAALAGIGALAIIAAGWTIYSRIKEAGRAEVRQEVENHNREATDAARKAREAHDLACARNEPGCLHNDWTRDRDR